MPPRPAGKMEFELKCPLCRRWFYQPLLLPCGHSICKPCAPDLICSAEEAVTAERDSDQLSVASETDSGVCMNSRPGSYVGIGSLANLAILPSSGLGLVCPVSSCKRSAFLSEHGVESLMRNYALERVVERYAVPEPSCPAATANYCQLCEDQQSKAIRFCEQCEVAYCTKCLETCHPARGALAKHLLLQPRPATFPTPPNLGSPALGSNCKKKSKTAISCLEHVNLALDRYCVTCKSLICEHCSVENHAKHECQPAASICKTQKTELSHILQALSEKAKSGTEFIQHLKTLPECINNNCLNFEEKMMQQLDSLQTALTEKRTSLVRQLHAERDHKNRMVKEQVAHCSTTLTSTTAVLHFCIEMLKESDPVAFLTVSQTLMNRAWLAEHNFARDIEMRTKVDHEFKLQLACESLLRAIETLTFFEFKDGNCQDDINVGHVFTSEANLLEAPAAPIIMPEECQVIHNKVTVFWRPCPGPPVDSYTLELDDGARGAYRKVYRGPETLCMVEGLHFKTVYQARVQAHNSSGDSAYSDYIKLQTDPLAWFSLESEENAPADVILCNDGSSVSTEGCDDRVVLCSTAFSRGVHYWQFTIDRYENSVDIAFGVALKDVAREGKLGKDNLGWAMYIDAKRSWFLHANNHSERCDGGIGVGSVVGVRLDCDKGTLSYYLNEEPHGPVAFNQLKIATNCSKASPMFYPAVSLNRNVTLTLHTGIAAPSESDESSEDDK